MNEDTPFMNDKELLSFINRRERQLLVHSYIYYECNESIISDDQWTEWAKELVKLRDDNIDIFDQSAYADVFREFDYSTGYDLYSGYMRPEVIKDAELLLRILKGRDENDGRKH